MRNTLVAISLLALVGCGSESPLAPTTPTTTAPTPPPPNHSGTYVGANMIFELSSLPPLDEWAGTLTITHDGTLLIFSDLELTHDGGLDFSFSPGAATLDSTDHFAGTNTYRSSGCGIVTVRTTGWFAGDYMNLTARLTSSCPDSIEVRGEMRR